ncbi:MAG: TolB family protein [Gammaproteobacteria bacterium]
MTHLRNLGSSCVCLLTLLLFGCATTPVAAPSPSAEPADDANAAIAATVPSTDIVMIRLAPLLAGEAVPAATVVTQRRGYDNQPSFSPDGRSVWFSSISDDQQADVFRYDMASGRIARVTQTAESEYSPTPLGGGAFSCIQVALDGTQRLWRYTDGVPEAAIRADITGVGYHAWLRPEMLALFIVDEPMRLETVTLDGAPPRTVATNIGRSLHRTSRGTLAYVQKDADGRGTLLEYDPESNAGRLRAKLPVDGEDLVWLADGSALIANGRSIYRLPSAGSSWQELGDLTRSVAGDISRMAVSPNGEWLALVIAESE